LSVFWENYCDKHSIFDQQAKKRFQESNWAARPLSQEMLSYAAHDSHFLLHISFKMIQEMKAVPETQRESQDAKLRGIVGDINSAALDLTFLSRYETFCIQDSFNSFKKLIDFFDDESKEYLLSFYLYKELFEMREDTARRLNRNPNRVVEDDRTNIIYHLSHRVAHQLSK
jgi:ribonuclease D